MIIHQASQHPVLQAQETHARPEKDHSRPDSHLNPGSHGSQNPKPRMFGGIDQYSQTVEFAVQGDKMLYSIYPLVISHSYGKSPS